VIAVDTSVWIPYLHDDDLPVVRFLHARFDKDRIVAGDIVLTEVLQGVPDERVAAIVRARLERLHNPTMIGRRNAIQAAALYRRLRAAGVTIRKTVDLWIATWCIENGVPLLHQDRDFTAIARHEPGLIEVPVPDG
jgi:hypothetical protein